MGCSTNAPTKPSRLELQWLKKHQPWSPLSSVRPWLWPFPSLGNTCQVKRLPYWPYSCDFRPQNLFPMDKSPSQHGAGAGTHPGQSDTGGHSQKRRGWSRSHSAAGRGKASGQPRADAGAAPARSGSAPSLRSPAPRPHHPRSSPGRGKGQRGQWLSPSSVCLGPQATRNATRLPGHGWGSVSDPRQFSRL